MENSSDPFISTYDAFNQHEGILCFHQSQTVLYHAANVCFLLSYCAPNTRFGQVFLHMGLIIGYLFFSTWAWNVICAPSVFAWYFAFMILNLGQLLYILYQLRPIRFDDDLDNVYTSLFEPLKVTRGQFQRLVGAECAEIISLHAGECYAIENMTKTDKLSLLITGKINVINEKTFLHHIHSKEFLDSPEFESSNSEETFKVSICAAVTSKYIMWERSTLEYLFVKEPYLAHVMTALISQDITEKLYFMNTKLKAKDGSYLDIRLPGIAGRLWHMDHREHGIFKTNNKF